jgi:hypothetical protein
MEFVKDCDSGTGSSNLMCMKISSYEEVDVALLQWFNQKQAEGTSVFGPMCAQKAKFMKLWDWKVSSMPLLNG